MKIKFEKQLSNFRELWRTFHIAEEKKNILRFIGERDFLGTV